MDGARRPHEARDLRASRGSPARGRRARRRLTGQPPSRLTAPQGAEGRGTGGRPARGKSPHLSAGSRRGRHASRRPRPVLDQSPGGLQGSRRTTNRGGLMSTRAAETSVRTSIVVEAPIERAFTVFTEDFGGFKPPEHNMLEVEIAETVFETHVGGHVYDRGVDGSECRWARVLAYEPPTRVQLGHQSAVADRDRSREDQRGRGAVRCRGAGAHARRARAPQPRPPRRWLGAGARRGRLRGRLAALPAEVCRATQGLIPAVRERPRKWAPPIA